MNQKLNIKAKDIYILICIAFIFPSILYLIINGNIENFVGYYSWTFKRYNEAQKLIVDSSIFLIFLVLILFTYFKIIKSEKFGDIKKVYKYIVIVSLIFFIGLPNMSSDIFYYLGVGWLDANYNQNPYYVSVKEYRENNIKDDVILNNTGFWSESTSVYGAVWTLISKITSFLSFGSLTFGVYLFKLIELIAHLVNCYLIYKITKSKKWVLLYGLNPLILYHGITNGHNDIIVIMFVLLAMYFLLKKKNIYLSVISLGLSAGLKYFTVLLFPCFCLYKFRDESIKNKIIKSIKPGLVLILTILIPYIFYIQDFSVFTEMLVQGDKYGGSILKIIKTLANSQNLTKFIQILIYILFIAYYFNICIIKNLFTKKVTFNSLLSDYQKAILFFIFGVLSNFQIWYLIWLFPCLMWQRKKARNFYINIFSAGWIILYVYVLYQSDDSILNVFQSVAIICISIILLLMNKFKTTFKNEN